MSLPPEDDEPDRKDVEIPHQSLLSAMPKRTFYRVVLLLATLAGILYLRQRTGSIASCLSSAFQVPPPILTPPIPPTLKATVLLPDSGAGTTRR